MYLQQSQNVDVITGSGQVKVPIGTGLNGPTPSIPANDGSLAINLGNSQLYYVGGNAWKAATGDLVTLAAVGASPNANGASIAGQVLNLQPASATFPGVVTTGAQTFGGTKTFSAIIAPGTNYVAANPVVGSVANDGMAIDNIAKTITLELADQSHNGIVSTASQSYGGTKSFYNGLIVTPVVSNPNISNIFQHMYFETLQGSTFTMPGLSLACTVYVQRVGLIATISISETAYSGSSAPGLLVLTTPLRPEFRPLVARNSNCNMFVQNSPGIYAVRINTNGVVQIGGAFDQDSVLRDFGSEFIQIHDSTFSYNVGGV